MPQLTATPQLLLTIEEAADRLRIKRSMLYQLVGTGELKSIKVGRLRRIRVRDLEAFVDRLASGQEGQE